VPGLRRRQVRKPARSHHPPAGGLRRGHTCPHVTPRTDSPEASREFGRKVHFTRQRVAELRSNRLPGGATPWQKTFGRPSRPRLSRSSSALPEGQRLKSHHPAATMATTTSRTTIPAGDASAAPPPPPPPKLTIAVLSHTSVARGSSLVNLDDGLAVQFLHLSGLSRIDAPTERSHRPWAIEWTR